MLLEFTLKYAFLFILYRCKQLGFLLLKWSTIQAQAVKKLSTTTVISLCTVINIC